MIIIHKEGPGFCCMTRTAPPNTGDWNKVRVAWWVLPMMVYTSDITLCQQARSIDKTCQYTINQFH